MASINGLSLVLCPQDPQDISPVCPGFDLSLPCFRIAAKT